ncbi:hypothetical protein F5Y18DRAFT_430436 [Xylariaceae sp. FL1019]|nr:hypothetical protein F5Y18DRAFT_430436 [Xylariaceae sp. FL1019]
MTEVELEVLPIDHERNTRLATHPLPTIEVPESYGPDGNDVTMQPPAQDTSSASQSEDGKLTGFFSVAATQRRYENLNMQRAWRSLASDALSFYSCQLSCICQELRNVSVQEAEYAKNGPRRQSFPFNEEKFLRRCKNSPYSASVSEIPDETDFGTIRENLFSNATAIFRIYCDWFHWTQMVSKLPQVDEASHKAMLEYISQGYKGDRSPLAYLEESKDFVYANSDVDPLLDRFQYVFMASGNKMKSALNYLCFGKTLLDTETSQHIVYKKGRVRLHLKITLALLSSSLVLAPVAILYLLDMSHQVSFVVVAAFGIVFALGLLVFEPRASYFVVGIVAYYAVLSAFLSNSM